KCRESLFVYQRQTISVKRQLLGTEGAPQSSYEFSTKDTAENTHRQEEVTWCGEAALVIGCQASAWHKAVNGGRRLQGLSPSVQDAEEAHLGAEMFRICRHFQQGSSR